MTTILRAVGLGKRYRRRWALRDCDLEVPAGRVAGLVGSNGAGKTTLLHLAVGLLQPTTGEIEVVGGAPAADPKQLGRVGFVAQQTPVYSHLSVADHLRLGGWLNPRWDAAEAGRRIDDLGLDPSQRAGKLSGGQRAQLALTLALAKRPELLVLDEPVASLDPLARREFLQVLMAAVADDGTSVLLSSHLVADLERVCDYLVVLAGGRVQLTGDVDDVLASHVRLTGPARETVRAPTAEVIETHRTERQTSVLVRTEAQIYDSVWTQEPVDLEELVLAYLRRGERSAESDQPETSGAGHSRVVAGRFR